MESTKSLQADSTESSRWWPEELGEPSAAGRQNEVRYAYFRSARRLVLFIGERVRKYDTGDHDIQDVVQAGNSPKITLRTVLGTVNLSQLRRI